MALTIAWTYTPLATDQRIDTEAINNLLGSLSIQLSGALGSVTLGDGSVTWPKLSSNLLSGGTAHSGALAGSDLAIVHCAADGGIRTCTLTELLNVGLSFATDTDWAIGDYVYGETSTGTKQKGTVPNSMRRLIGSHTNTLSGLSAIDLTTDYGIVYDANGGSGATGDNAKVFVDELIRSVTDRLITTAGTSTAYTLTASDHGANVTGTAYKIKLHTSCGATPTLNVNAAGAKAIRKAGDVAVASGDFASGEILDVTYDSTANGGSGAWMVNGWGRGVRRYDSGNVSIPAILTATSLAGSYTTSWSGTAHSLGGVPDSVSVRLVCTTNDNDWVVGEEIDINDVLRGGPDNHPALTVWWDATKVYAMRTDSANWYVQQHASPLSYVPITESSWRIRVRAARFV